MSHELRTRFWFDAVRHGVFFDMEADFRFWGCGRRLEQRAELMKDFTQGGVVEEQRFVNFCQALEDGSVGSEVLAHFNKGADDLDAHGNSAGAVENSSCHKGPVFGESEG